MITGGLLRSRKGINLPGVRLDLPPLTDKDLSDLELGLESGVDWVALSFVRSPGDIARLRRELRQRGSDLPIVAKIEKQEAVEALDAVVEEADAVMIARGDLGVEMALEDIPLIQKRIIEAAASLGKPVITATQMLQSMISSPTPTRAEVSDVANAVFDATDAVMLSGETAVGGFPVEAVDTMRRVVLKAETTLPYDHWLDERRLLDKQRHGRSGLFRRLRAGQADGRHSHCGTDGIRLHSAPDEPFSPPPAHTGADSTGSVGTPPHPLLGSISPAGRGEGQHRGDVRHRRGGRQAGGPAGAG